MRRCFRYEYVIRTIIITCIFILNILYFVFLYSKLPFLSLFSLLSFPVLIVYNVIITIQRGHDLGFSGQEVFFLRQIPIVDRFAPYLLLKEGDCGINEYDEAINYKKLFNARHCIDIYDNMFIKNKKDLLMWVKSIAQRGARNEI
jgi:uncharacterized membrane protein YhaH (DUF805 family)